MRKNPYNVYTKQTSYNRQVIWFLDFNVPSNAGSSPPDESRIQNSFTTDRDVDTHSVGPDR